MELDTFYVVTIPEHTKKEMSFVTKKYGTCLGLEKEEKQVYVPVNHVNPETLERLPNQLTEQDIHDELQWLVNNKNNCKFIFHNGKFDFNEDIFPYAVCTLYNLISNME